LTGAELYLSDRTVEWHLHKVFTKLGIRTRRQLPESLFLAGERLRRPSGRKPASASN
jgi:DNA-binding CsgD family transcriptional regulator